jgi:hypothetical protein
VQLACQVAEAGRGKPLLGRGDSESADRVAAAGVLHNRDSGHTELVKALRATTEQAAGQLL